jgi:regulator of cell morphogenesis and NO signaling
VSLQQTQTSFEQQLVNAQADAAAPMAALIGQIIATHHALLRRQIPRVEQIARDITGYGAEDEPALVEIRQLAGGLAACVQTQLDREEQILFPMLARLEQQTEVTRCHAGMIRSRLMMAERDLARIRGVITRLRELAREHLSPAGPCEACHELLRVVDVVLADLHEHTRKECEVLFPWAIEREAALVR